MLASSRPGPDFDETSSDECETFLTPSSRNDEDEWLSGPSSAFSCHETQENIVCQVAQNAAPHKNNGSHGFETNYNATKGLRLSCISGYKPAASPRITLTQPEFDPFAAAFSEELLRSRCHSPGHIISPSSSSTSTLVSPEQLSTSLPDISTEDSSGTLDNGIDHHHIADKQPRLLKTNVSDFVPTTSARVYSPRFPLGHTLCSNFVSKYSLDGELGSGGYGFVMAARNRLDDNDVAVKFITKDKIPAHCWAYDDAGTEVPLEAKILAMLNHSGIVKFIDLYDDDLYFYLVQELHGAPWQKNVLPTNGGARTPSEPARTTSLLKRSIENTKVESTAFIPQRPSTVRRPSHDLFECLEQSKNKRFSEKDAKFIFAQVVDIVDYLDRHGITHCDIKDENVVVDKDLRIKLIDFGSVVVADPSQPRPTYTKFFGTTAYASPEVALKQRYRAPAAEIWSLGILLSYLLTGMSPFITESDKMAGRIMLDSSANVSRTCLHLMTRCLQADPEQRADIAEVKAHPWLEGALV